MKNGTGLSPGSQVDGRLVGALAPGVESLPDRDLLCVSHSDRMIDRDRCSLSFLVERYASEGRLATPPPFTSLEPSAHSNPFLGSLTLWTFENDDPCRPALLAHARPVHYKPQHAVWHNQHLWVIGVEHVYVYDSRLRLIRTITDPWAAGGHTITIGNDGQMITTWSASDSVILIDKRTMEVTRACRLPESMYGQNYRLMRDDCVVDHFIPNDLQLTHINAAWPSHDGILVSLLIQGAIGCFGADGDYREIVRGFVGCHGIRTSASRAMYFCDSCAGTVNFIDTNGRVQDHIDFHSDWLHDALELAPGLFAAAVADRNAVEIIGIPGPVPITRIEGSPFGESVQFLSYGR